MTECASSREAFTAQARVDGKECEVRLERGWFGWKRLARGRTTGEYFVCAPASQPLKILS